MKTAKPPTRRASRIAAKTAAITALTASVAIAQTGAEPYRPQFHFTPGRGWMNDPNGLVYYASEWHLFYQHNPFGDQWGHMSWGHAVSRDLVRWEHLPVALAEADSIMIFSGSAVVDWKNTSGFGKNGQPPLVAIYTGHHPPMQDQRIAYSTDSGRTWAKVPQPVLDLQMENFRDPKVFWHDASNSWVMLVAVPDSQRVHIYRSPDLRHWTFASDFTSIKPVGGKWESPDLFELPIQGTTERKWVLMLSVNPNDVSTTDFYLTGSFDGFRFVADSSTGIAPQVDYGSDFYAASTWNDVPASDSRRIMIAWMSSWGYAKDVPTSPWRGAMTFPRTLSLVRMPSGLRLAQQPVDEIKSLYAGPPRVFSGGTVAEAERWLERQGPLPLLADITVQFSDIDTTGFPFGLILRGGDFEDVSVYVDAHAKRYYVGRERSGLTRFSGWFPHTTNTAIDLPNRSVDIRMLIDASSVETFAQNGTVGLTIQAFPTRLPRRLVIETSQEPHPTVSRIVIQPLGSALRPWPPRADSGGSGRGRYIP